MSQTVQNVKEPDGFQKIEARPTDNRGRPIYRDRLSDVFIKNMTTPVMTVTQTAIIAATNQSEQSAAQMTGQVFAAASLGVSQSLSGFKHGYNQGRVAAWEKRRQIVSIPKTQFSGAKNRETFINDVADLATNPKTAKNINRMIPRKDVIDHLNTLFAEPSKHITFTLADVGIRHTENTAQAIRNYNFGGREALEKSNVLNREPANKPTPGYAQKQRTNSGGYER